MGTMTNMRKIYVCAPLEGDMAANLEKAKLYARYVLLCGAAPVVPHFYALVVDEERPDERQKAIDAGLSLLWLCDETWAFGEEITPGMREEIRFCKSLNIPVRYVKNARLEENM